MNTNSKQTICSDINTNAKNTQNDSFVFEINEGY